MRTHGISGVQFANKSFFLNDSLVRCSYWFTSVIEPIFSPNSAVPSQPYAIGQKPLVITVDHAKKCGLMWTLVRKMPSSVSGNVLKNRFTNMTRSAHHDMELFCFGFHIAVFMMTSRCLCTYKANIPEIHIIFTQGCNRTHKITLGRLPCQPNSNQQQLTA